MTATDIDLDTLLDALAARARSRAASTPLVNEAGEIVTPYASTGRITVNPGDIIASTWGNTTFDQSVQAYDNPAARDAQWPAPKDGAACYTADTGTLWLRRAGVWVQVAPPASLVARAKGPAAQTDLSSTTNTALVTISQTLNPGRYKISGHGAGVCVNAAPNWANAILIATGVDVVNNYLFSLNLAQISVNGQIPGATFTVITLAAPTACTFTIAAAINVATSSLLRFVANSCELLVEQIG